LSSNPCHEDFPNTKYILPSGWELTKKDKWQYHKNPEAGSAGQPEADTNPGVEESTKAVLTGAGSLPAKKPNIVSIISSGCRRFVWWVII